MERIEHYWEAVREKVCVNCIDGDGYGNCRLPSVQECAVRLYFPRILQAVQSVNSDRMGVYVDALRRTVCAECCYSVAGGPVGRCSLRDHVDCELDRYFPLVVEAIEGVGSKIGEKIS
jgi:hypothetical protein